MINKLLSYLIKRQSDLISVAKDYSGPERAYLTGQIDEIGVIIGYIRDEIQKQKERDSG